MRTGGKEGWEEINSLHWNDVVIGKVWVSGEVVLKYWQE